MSNCDNDQTSKCNNDQINPFQEPEDFIIGIIMLMIFKDWDVKESNHVSEESQRDSCRNWDSDKENTDYDSVRESR